MFRISLLLVKMKRISEGGDLLKENRGHCAIKRVCTVHKYISS